MFQLMFAIITVALISGAIADRTRFLTWGIFAAIWVSIVYFPVAHWVFDFGGTELDGQGDGWLAGLGVEDFAGGTAVHINAGAAGLALAIVLGKRVGWPKTQMKPHSLPLVLLGSGLLYFGWFGFNAGSALGANQTAAIAFTNTMIATAAGIVGWSHHGEAARRAPHVARCRLGRGRWSGGDHPGLCVHRALGRNPSGPARRRALCTGGRAEVPVPDR